MNVNPSQIEASGQALQTRVLRLLQARQSECLDNLDVCVSQGTVVMTGCVASRSLRRTIRECCCHVPGVRGTIDQLVVSGGGGTSFPTSDVDECEAME
ncbi:MAG: BON domain-containing protein [Planctomycetaceae bacterium]|nr:BON domain-containing protein [Planctomycetaceae bacterium]